MVIQLAYKKILFSISLNQQIRIANNLTFVLRSVLGNELRKMCCVLRQKKCSECSLRYSCVYSWFFETPIMKDNAVAAGRDKVSHPFVHSVLNIPGSNTNRIDYQITFIGKAINYIPYIFFALQRAGKKGLFRERIPFHINDVYDTHDSIYCSEDDIDLTRPPQKWKFEAEKSEKNLENGKINESKKLTVTLITPFRLRKKGIYTSDINPADIFISAQRRISTLVGLYSERDGKENSGKSFYEQLTAFRIHADAMNNRLKVLKKDLVWEDMSYYSGRQKQAMKLGGAAGSITWEGTLTAYEKKLLEAGEIFHIGKNVSFGLGKILVETEKGENDENRG